MKFWDRIFSLFDIILICYLYFYCYSSHCCLKFAFLFFGYLYFVAFGWSILQPSLSIHFILFLSSLSFSQQNPRTEWIWFPPNNMHSDKCYVYFPKWLSWVYLPIILLVMWRATISFYESSLGRQLFWVRYLRQHLKGKNIYIYIYMYSAASLAVAVSEGWELQTNPTPPSARTYVGSNQEMSIWSIITLASIAEGFASISSVLLTL